MGNVIEPQNRTDRESGKGVVLAFADIRARSQHHGLKRRPFDLQQGNVVVRILRDFYRLARLNVLTLFSVSRNGGVTWALVMTY